MSGTVESEWESYKKEVIDAEAPEGRLLDIRLAFYAGCLASLSLLSSDARPLGDRFKAIYDELMAYSKAVEEKFGGTSGGKGDGP